MTKYLKGTISGEEADGFIPRFQVLVYPDPPAEYVHVDRWPDKDAKNEAYEIFKAIDRLDPGSRGCKVEDDSGLHYLNFADDAQSFFNEWYTNLQRRLRSGELTDVMAAHLAKYGSLMPSLALIFHLVDEYRSALIGDVSLEAAETAAAWCEVGAGSPRLRRVYQSLTTPMEISTAAAGLAEYGSRPACRTRSPIGRSHRRGGPALRTVEDAPKQASIGILEDRYWVKVVEVASDDPQGRGRPSIKVWVNPKLRPRECGRECMSYLKRLKAKVQNRDSVVFCRQPTPQVPRNSGGRTAYN